MRDMDTQIPEDHLDKIRDLSVLINERANILMRERSASGRALEARIEELEEELAILTEARDQAEAEKQSLLQSHAIEMRQKDEMVKLEVQAAQNLHTPARREAVAHPANQVPAGTNLRRADSFIEDLELTNERSEREINRLKGSVEKLREEVKGARERLDIAQDELHAQKESAQYWEKRYRVANEEKKRLQVEVDELEFAGVACSPIVRKAH